MSTRFFFFDTETGGLDPTEHSLLTLAYAIVDYSDTTKQFSTLLEKELAIVEPPEIQKVTEYALKVNRIDLEKHNQMGISPQAALEIIMEDIRQYYTLRNDFLNVTPAGHNVHFDIGYMKRLFRIVNGAVEPGNYEKVFNHRPFDTCSTIRFLDMAGVTSVGKADLDSAMTYYGVTMNEADRHTALGDIRATVQVAQSLIEAVQAFAPTANTNLIIPKNDGELIL
jgi:DNA polymerase III epsilon subunit-like protein